ncbi:unnamed protein product, partial [Mesorhabditis belari]|uniref:EGF-like domain-containing protein n=1 Tax=Mesorhabditis belari TaxID=2138241 RepID=A0AAF3EH29_9BILA
MIRRLIPLLLLVLPIALAEDIEAKCRSAEGASSCGQCIKQHPDCGWCRDPHSKLSSRCQLKSKLTADVCNQQYVYSPVTEMKVDHRSLPLQQIDPRTNSPVQVSPQQVEVKIKEDETMKVEFKFFHKDSGPAQIKDFQIMTSNFSNTGVDVTFIIDCHGKKVEGKKCDKVPDGTVLAVTAVVKLTKCSDRGSIPITVGAYGARSIGALYVSPLCGCECERLHQIEKNSPLCYQHGNLICGQCECQPGRGGHNCDCPLSLYGVSTDAELTNKCREKPGAPVCGGHGQCKCGQCACDNPATTGKFCSCDNTDCPRGGPNNQTCFGHGVCECGKCECEDGWTRGDCSCTTQMITCMEGTLVCSGHGKCECGRCVCNEGFTGATCNAEEPQDETSSPQDDKPLTPTTAAPKSKETSEIEENDDAFTQPPPMQPEQDIDSTEQPEESSDPQSAHLLTTFIALLLPILRYL